MANLTEIDLENRDIRDSEIPEIWRESFMNFMTGQACSAELDDDGNVKEFIYYACDFRAWYYQNKQAIERDIKINQVYE